MKYFIYISLLLFANVSLAQDEICEQIQELTEKIQSVKELSFDEKMSLDDQIMTLQFEKTNELFEKLREQLDKIIIVDDLLEELTTPTIDDISIPTKKDSILSIIKGLSASQIKNKFNLTNANKNGYSLREIADEWMLDTTGSKTKVSIRIWEAINQKED